MRVEREFVPRVPHRLPPPLELAAIVQAHSEGRHVVEEDAHAELPRECLGRDDRLAVIG